MLWLNGVYIGCTVFSVGVTALDFLGFLSGGHDSDSSDGDTKAELDAGVVHGGEVDGGGVDLGSDHSADGGHTEETGPADISHPAAGVAVLSVLSYLRSFIYFCLGFGPTGWVAMAMGHGAGQSLIWAAPAGVVSFVLARAFFRFQHTDTDSSLRSAELLFQKATVIIPLTHDTMGKVRVQVGMNVTEQYALATEPKAQFEKGDTVWVTNITDECVYVEHENMGKE